MARRACIFSLVVAFVLLMAAPLRAADDAFKLRAISQDGAIHLQWTAPANANISHFLVFRLAAPNEPTSKPLATLSPSSQEYLDHVSNWTPSYYRIKGVDAADKPVMESALIAAVARPGGPPPPPQTFAFWYEPYKPTTDPHPSIDKIGHTPLIMGQGSLAAQDLKKQGVGVLPYVTYYQTAGWAGPFSANTDPKVVAEKLGPIGFYRPSLHFASSPPGYLPSVFCRPGNVEYDPKSIQYTTCPNSAAFRKMALTNARQELDGGALGFFVDNGYEDDIAANQTCESPHHEHFYGTDLTSADAYLGLLLEVQCEIKKGNPRGLLIVNGGVPGNSNFYGLTFHDVCDGTVWESYLRSSYSTPKEHLANWQEVYHRSVELEKSATEGPAFWTYVLSYPWNRDEAFFCYATAKLCNLPWSANLGDSDPNHTHFGGHFGTYPQLVNLRLGNPIHSREFGGFLLGAIYVREYERGLVAVNPSAIRTKFNMGLGQRRKYINVFSGDDGEGDSISAELPPESGRVFLWR